MNRLAAALLATVAVFAPPTYAQEIDFVEDFALAKDRAVPLKQLIPGTRDYYYYHCLDHQMGQRFAEVEGLLKLWIKRHGHTQRVEEIVNRQALLTYSKNHAKTLDHLRRRLGLHFNHQRERLGAKPNLPTQLKPGQISRETLTRRAMQSYRNTGGFEDRALDWLIALPLDSDRRRHLLNRLRRPDYQQLPKLVIDDLSARHSRGFGSHPVHGQMLPTQLNDLLRRKPDLLNQGKFVNAYISKLRPSTDVDWRGDAKEYQAYLERLWTFVSRLAPVHNSLKAHVLYHRLVFDRDHGVYDADRFDAYLALPRSVNYGNRKYLALNQNRRYPANLSSNFRSQTQLPAVGNDEPLVRSYLLQAFRTATSTRRYERFVDDTYLKHAFAEAKILAGLGDMEQWYSMLPPAKYKALKDRVDLDFAFTRRTHFAADEAVSLELAVKNVPTLIVKVYEINASNYYREQQRQVNTDINLDGLVANRETTFRYAEPSLRRVTRRFDFPELKGPGTYVVDFIGGGQSSRALIRKGELRLVGRRGSAGQVFTVFDEKNTSHPKATLWVGGREYVASAEGEITVPYSNAPGRQHAVVASGKRVSFCAFRQGREDYRLDVAFHVDRESLIKGKTAKLLVRASLNLGNTPISLKVLENVRLTIRSTDIDGVASTQEIPAFKLFEDRESLQEFKVPDRLSALTFSLTSSVKSLSQGKDVQLNATHSLRVNQIDASAQVDDVHLARIDGKYAIEYRGKTGELRARLPLRITLKHRDFRQTISVALQTDERGRAWLGALKDIEWVQIDPQGKTSLRVALAEDRRTYAPSLHAAAGEALEVPIMTSSTATSRRDVSLLEVRGATFVRDWFQNVQLDAKRQVLTLEGLPGGDYDLLLKRSGQKVRVRIAGGVRKGEHVLGAARQLEVRNETPLQIQSVDAGAKALTIRVGGTSSHTRVHVFATRFVPAFSAFERLAAVGDRAPTSTTLGSTPSVYLAGRDIGDEYRYILDRKYAKKFAGSMLKRPSVLLNPWAIRSTEAGTQDAKGGQRWGSGSIGRSGGSAGGGRGRQGSSRGQQFANLDFLANGSAVLLNLAPKNGVVTVGRTLLGAHQHVHVVAVDAEDTVTRSVSLPYPKTDIRDLRLLKGLNPKQHATERRQGSVVAKQANFYLQDITTSSFEAYDSLAKVYRLFTTLSSDPKLQAFSFVLNWPKLSFAEKCSKYSEFASHELNVFVLRKDPEFFKRVVLPYLRNKKDKTFIDRYLIGDDLRDQLEPWAYGRLNVVERIFLAARLKGGEHGATARHVKEQYEVLPPRPEHLQHLFQTALKSSALDTGDAFGMDKAKLEAAPEKKLDFARRVRSRGNAGPMGGRAAGELAEEEMDMDDAAPADMPAPSAAPAPPRPGKAMKAKKKEQLRRQAGKDTGRWRDEGERRKSVRQLYRKLDKTKEWVENNYYKLPIEVQKADLITVNAFWRDLAAHPVGQPFQSAHFAEASRNFPEMMFALAVLDLPFESPKHKTQFAGPKMALTAGGPMVVFHKQIRLAEPAEGKSSILVSQNVFKHGDRHRIVNGERVDKFVTDEFLVHTVYGCQVVVTNPTSSRLKLDILLQIPRGALPVLRGHTTQSVQVTLDSYRTHSLVYQFYFPRVGTWEHFPAHVAKAERHMANAEAMTFKVVDTPSTVDKESWDYVSQQGTPQQVIAYLGSHNLQETPLARIAWRMKDRAFFLQVVDLLRKRHVYDSTLWSYGIKHDVLPVAKQFLLHADAFIARCGTALESPLLTIDPVERRAYQHMDYAPLVNARAHTLGRRRRILNGRFYAQYHRLLNVLKHRGRLGSEDLLDMTYYMLLQDRVEEGLGFFRRVDPTVLPSKIQYDYFDAYLSMILESPKKARALCAQYTKHPVDRWRALFGAVSLQLDELEGRRRSDQPGVTDPKDRNQAQDGLAATEASVEMKVESKAVTLDYQNVKSARVNYYLMDVELLFSRNPFVKQVSGQFSFILPNATEVHELPAGKSQLSFALPERFHTSNVLVEVVAGGQTHSQPYYSNSLAVQVVEGYGQVRVTSSSGKTPLSKVYVKVYAEMKDGKTRFYKDGYTDLRGRFDYASLNTNELEYVKRFSLLVLSENQGAVVKKASPPKR
jgi:hypothetical protein